MENTSLVLSYLTIDEEQQLFDALQLALINDSTNLYKLQKLFYPPGEVSPDTVVITSFITVNTISHEARCDDHHPPTNHAFRNSSNYYVRNSNLPYDPFSVSNDPFSNSQAKLTAHINSINNTLDVLEYVSYHIIMTITNIHQKNIILIFIIC